MMDFAPRPVTANAKSNQRHEPKRVGRYVKIKIHKRVHEDGKHSGAGTEGKRLLLLRFRVARQTPSLPVETKQDRRHQHKTEDTIVGRQVQNVVVSELRMDLQMRISVSRMNPFPRAGSSAQKRVMLDDSK